MLFSKFGVKEGAVKNNHATFYALQVAELANYVEDKKICINELNKVKNVLIKEQIKKDGSMPAELVRTKPIHYSLFNLSAFTHLAILGDIYNIDLWNAKSVSSGSIIDAIDFIINKIYKLSNNKTEKINYSYVIGVLKTASTNIKYKEKYK